MTPMLCDIHSASDICVLWYQPSVTSVFCNTYILWHPSCPWRKVSMALAFDDIHPSGDVFSMTPAVCNIQFLWYLFFRAPTFCDVLMSHLSSFSCFRNSLTHLLSLCSHWKQSDISQHFDAVDIFIILTQGHYMKFGSLAVCVHYPFDMHSSSCINAGDF
jgi:hypothetical protein